MSRSEEMSRPVLLAMGIVRVGIHEPVGRNEERTLILLLREGHAATDGTSKERGRKKGV